MIRIQLGEVEIAATETACDDPKSGKYCRFLTCEAYTSRGKCIACDIKLLQSPDGRFNRCDECIAAEIK